MMNQKATTHFPQNQMMELSETLFTIEKDRMAGKAGYTLDELDASLDDVIAKV